VIVGVGSGLIVEARPRVPGTGLAWDECEAVVAMVLPGFTAEHALVPTQHAFRGRARPIGSAAPVVQPQGQTTCEVAYIEGREGLWVVCCDMEQSPPCTATGIG
jgi:hypothetical protein